ncbi:MAG: hypothetical protein SGARI_005745 [Bacillariaceae sp.]
MARPLTLLNLSDNTKLTDDEKSGANASNSDGNDGNKAMAFLKKIGRIGGANKVDFTSAIGVDEGSSTKTAGKWGSARGMKKSKDAFRSCTDTGLIDDLSETFPTTSSGCQWDGVTDRVMGGVSSGTLSREDFYGRTSNVLRANVKLDNNGGFVQMATDLALNPSVSN